MAILNESHNRTNFSVILDAGESYVAQVSADISTVIVSVDFIDTTGSATVYDSVNDDDIIEAIVAGGTDNAIWTKWNLGDITEASTDKRSIAFAPNAVKFENLSDTERVRFNFRGNFE